MFGEGADEANLVGGPGTTSCQDEGEIAVLSIPFLRLLPMLHVRILEASKRITNKRATPALADRSVMRIGIISDTHGRVHPGVPEAFAGVDHILHAGDIGGEEILGILRRIAPVTAVAGNIDDFQCGEAGGEARIELDGTRFYLTHIIDRPHQLAQTVEQSLSAEEADVIVFGHSHWPHDERIGKRWYFNPASAGPRRFDYPVSVGVFESKRGHWLARHVVLDERSQAGL